MIEVSKNGTKITILGAGNVGASCAYTFAAVGTCSEIVLVDINKEKAQGEAMDIRQGIPFCHPVDIYAGDYEDAVGSDIVIVTLGLARKPGQTRLDLAQANVDIIKEVMPRIAKVAPNSIYIVVSNPVDILTYAILKCTNLSPNQVIGSGTMLDTSRLRSCLADHVHLSAQDIETLFGAGATLTEKKPLSQPGQFACEERVTLVGPKKSIPNVIILGPARPATQVEVSLTDARTLGVKAPVRESGDIEGSGACKLVGPEGEVEIPVGVIAAKRHIHLTPADAEEFGVADKEIVSVQIDSDGRSTVFGDVVVRVSPKFAAAMHIDTDESNAACAFGECYGEIIK